MLKLKLLVACVLMQGSVFAWSQSTQQAPASAPAAASAQSGLLSNAPSPQNKSNVTTGSNVTGLVCTFFIANFSWRTLSFVLSSYSTYKVEPSCNEDYYEGLTLASITAQSRIVGRSTKMFRGGVHAKTMDVNLSPVSDLFFSVGNLNFSKVGEVRIGLISSLRKEVWKITNIVNMTYSAFNYESQIHYIWNIGSLIHRLVSPNGDTYIMYAYTNEVMTDLKRETLIDLGSQLRLPEGWRYENILLNKTITVKPTPFNDFGSDVLFDELNNYYVKYQH
jgi:hypothetical protein